MSELESQTETEPRHADEAPSEREIESAFQETAPTREGAPAETAPNLSDGLSEPPEWEAPEPPEPTTESLEAEPAPEPRRARVHPLATFLIGLVIGLFIGYGGRPSATAPATQPQATRTPVLPGQARNASGAPTLMDTLIAQTRHFKGDPNAPVTIIEFSDFQ